MNGYIPNTELLLTMNYSVGYAIGNTYYKRSPNGIYGITFTTLGLTLMLDNAYYGFYEIANLPTGWGYIQNNTNISLNCGNYQSQYNGGLFCVPTSLNGLIFYNNHVIYNAGNNTLIDVDLNNSTYRTVIINTNGILYGTHLDTDGTIYILYDILLNPGTSYAQWETRIAKYYAGSWNDVFTYKGSWNGGYNAYENVNVNGSVVSLNNEWYFVVHLTNDGYSLSDAVLHQPEWNDVYTRHYDGYVGPIISAPNVGLASLYVNAKGFDDTGWMCLKLPTIQNDLGYKANMSLPLGNNTGQIENNGLYYTTMTYEPNSLSYTLLPCELDFIKNCEAIATAQKTDYTNSVEYAGPVVLDANNTALTTAVYNGNYTYTVKVSGCKSISRTFTISSQYTLAGYPICSLSSGYGQYAYTTSATGGQQTQSAYEAGFNLPQMVNSGLRNFTWKL